MPLWKNGTVAAVLVIAAGLIGCGGVTDPIQQNGFRVENRTADSLFVMVVAQTPLTDIFLPRLNDSVPPTRVDSTRLTFPLDSNELGRAIAPGASLAFLPGAISGYDPAYHLVVVLFRVRRGYLVAAGGYYVLTEDIRSNGPKIVLRDGRFYPNILR